MQPSLDRAVVPAPVAVAESRGTEFTLARSTRILVPSGSSEAARIGTYLAGLLRPSTGYPLPVEKASGTGGRDVISIELAGAAQPGHDRPGAARPGAEGGDRGHDAVEGYELNVTGGAVTLRASRPEGLFRGVQTLRQLLPASIESTATRPGPWRIPGGRVIDRPRFAWRGAALDVARHFFTVREVQRYIDLISLYKLNVLHLHLTDDQGWRIAVESWPRLATHGGSTAVGGGRGGFYSRQEYWEIVRYAQDRYVTVVPEIDVPGHTTAALASYPELSCDGRAPALYTGVDVGFSSLCLDNAATYQFLDDVIGEVAALTPGPYIHIGGDEVRTVGDDRYAAFVERVQRIVQAHGKRSVGWQETAKARLLPTSVVQYWDERCAAADVRRAVRRGTKLLLSPASRVYLDMKYDGHTRLGTEWAGHVEVRDAYEWDPATLLDGVGVQDVLGVEAPLWSETVRSVADVEHMAFPRLAGVAEVAWSPAAGRQWDCYRQRLAAQGPRWSAMAVNYYRSPQVPWPGPG